MPRTYHLPRPVEVQDLRTGLFREALRSVELTAGDLTDAEILALAGDEQAAALLECGLAIVDGELVDADDALPLSRAA